MFAVIRVIVSSFDDEEGDVHGNTAVTFQQIFPTREEAEKAYLPPKCLRRESDYPQFGLKWELFVKHHIKHLIVELKTGLDLEEIYIQAGVQLEGISH